MPKKFFHIIFIMCVAMNAHSQRPTSGMWWSLQMPVELTAHWQWHNDGGYRTLGNFLSPYQYLYRTGVRYKWQDNWNAAAGIAFFFTRSSFLKTNNEFGREFRCWQELNNLRLFTKWLQMGARLRTEQRFFTATQFKAAYTAFRLRLKPVFTALVTKNCSLQLAGEYMRQFAHGRFSFDQNRLMIAAIYKLNVSAQLQGGYMWLYWPDHSSQHILTVGFQKNITTRGNKS